MRSTTRVVIITTVMLTFISFWRAAAVVLSDLASTAYYIGGIAEEAIGKAAPWFILLVMLFSYAVRSVYMESCSMFVRGGVYRIVKEAMGGTMAKISVSALIFDYILTGPISAVSAGQYIHGLADNSLKHLLGFACPVPADVFSVVFALAVTCYFWWLNTKGIEESSDKALKIMKITTVMVVLIVVWGIVTMAHRDNLQLPPLKPELKPHSLGWLHGADWLTMIPLVVFMVGFGHSILAMSGEETLAQVYREIEAPKHKNLVRAGLVIFVFSMVLTPFVSFAATMLVPDAERALIKDNLIGGLVMHLWGPAGLRLTMQAFVVCVGALILSGAVNTSMIGSNGVLNRVAEDGILDDWFRTPHRRYGTTYRLINLIALLQIVTILVSRGNIYVLGEAYAFGVVWSFTFMGLAMLLLRWKYTGERGWKVPFNFQVRGVEIPVGLALVELILIAVAFTNLLTKQVATISGCAFTASFFVLFSISEWHSRRKGTAALTHGHREKFLLDHKESFEEEHLNLPGHKPRVLVPVRDPHNLEHLRAVLEESHDRGTEIVVATIKVEKGDKAFENLFTSDEELLFTNVVQLAEKYGETIIPLVVPSNNSWFAIARTAKEVDAAEVVLGRSAQLPVDVQMEQLTVMSTLVRDENSKPIRFRVIGSGGPEVSVTV